MAIAVYFHPKSLSTAQYDEAIKELEPLEPGTRLAGFTTPAPGPTAI